jgi:hypothetical protein
MIRLALPFALLTAACGSGTPTITTDGGTDQQAPGDMHIPPS